MLKRRWQRRSGLAPVEIANGGCVAMKRGGGLGHCWKRLCQVLMTKRSFGDGTEALVIDTELMCFHNT